MKYRLALAAAAALLISACAPKPQPRVVPGATSRPLAVKFIATAYCRGRLTRSGTPVAAGIIAADPGVLPLGSIVRISGLAPYDGTYTVRDTGPAVRGRHIDLYMADCAAARRFGRRTAEILLVGRDVSAPGR